MLEILKNHGDYRFTWDGQTIVLEDYLEIRSEKQNELLTYIRESRISVGPWYILPDIWLVGEESLIRNLEYSFDICKNFNIPYMKIGYLPDMFGHSKVIPQLLNDLTDFKAAIVWRGVPPEIRTIPFKWKGDKGSKASILGTYLPFGYGNAADLPEEVHKLEIDIKELVSNLEPYTPSSLPIYLLNHGTDHQIPNEKLISKLKSVKIENMEIRIQLIEDYIDKLIELIKERNYVPFEYVGEFRSSFKANLLQDTYSSRMWIKQWNQKVEDLLTHYAEPLSTYLWFYFQKKYPSSFLTKAWKWHLQNQPHDSICGCSIDQTHEEMKIRYYWAESIVETVIEDCLKTIEENSYPSDQDNIIAYNPTNSAQIPVNLEIKIPGKEQITSIRVNDHDYEVQRIDSSSDILWEMTTSSLKLKALMRLVPGRQIMNIFINEASITDGEDSNTCEVRIIVAEKPISNLDINSLKKNLIEVINSKKYDRFHIIVSKEIEQRYLTLLPLIPWSFTNLEVTNFKNLSNSKIFQVSDNYIENKFYQVKFTKDGHLNYFDKDTGIKFFNLHQFEDWGDRGDEYTFGRLNPEYAKVKEVKRELLIKGRLFSDIKQIVTLEVFGKIGNTRDIRIEKRKILISTRFRFYRDSPRIDILTEFINETEDHRLRVCFNLPYSSKCTITSTHFGVVKRFGEPEEAENYMEKPSGIQAQKRFIRVNDSNPEGKIAFTLINKGLPEVELVDGSKLCLTLIRSIGWLSRSDIPERSSGHAGPYLETPGAQEINKRYQFEYSFLIHGKNDPISLSADHAEVFALPVKSLYFRRNAPNEEILSPIIQLTNNNLRISSLRVRDNNLITTVYNLSNNFVSGEIKCSRKSFRVAEILINGTEKFYQKKEDGYYSFQFDPHEIKLLNFEFAAKS